MTKKPSEELSGLIAGLDSNMNLTWVQKNVIRSIQQRSCLINIEMNAEDAKFVNHLHEDILTAINGAMPGKFKLSDCSLYPYSPFITWAAEPNTIRIYVKRGIINVIEFNKNKNLDFVKNSWSCSLIDPDCIEKTVKKLVEIAE